MYGQVVGGSYWAAPEATEANKLSTSKKNPMLVEGDRGYQYWNFENVYYVANKMTVKGAETEVLYPLGNSGGGFRLNGKDDVTFKPDTDYTGKGYGVERITLAELPNVLFAWNVQMSVTLTDDLAVNVYADKDYTILNGENAVANMNGDSVTAKVVGNEYKFTYADLLPQQIGDDVVVTLGAVKKTFTIKDYLVKLLADEKAQDVAADLLRYGAAAQVKANYNVDALVTDGVALEGLGTSFDAAAMEVVAPVTANKQNIAGVALRLENALALVAKDAEGNVIATTSLNADQMDKNITLTAEDGSTVDVSVAWYVQQALNGGVDEQVDLDLIAAIYAYGLSAAAYNA
jgi:hypothetical protein